MLPLRQGVPFALRGHGGDELGDLCVLGLDAFRVGSLSIAVGLADRLQSSRPVLLVSLRVALVTQRRGLQLVLAFDLVG